VSAVRKQKEDYYDLLGVPRDADEGTIRRAFIAAARECHPDVSSSPESERKFRDLAEAYSVLSKPEARLLYDRYGYRGRGNSGFDETLWEEAREPVAPGDNVRIPLELLESEVESGTRRLVEFTATRVCSACDGLGTKRAPDPDCPECEGTGRRGGADGNGRGRGGACKTCHGEVCPTCGGEGLVQEERRLRVRIPPGLEDGAQLRVAGEGDMGTSGVSGDLLVDVHIVQALPDSPLLRYVALGLFLAALALLIIYLL
jgi:molecular chaperone DnaJ